MGSIRKIALTPVKWASKQLLHRTLLRFPGGDAHDPIACAYCPEMCRFSCPTAIASGNDAVSPCNKMSLLHKEARWPGRAAAGGALWPIYDCTGCGRCTEYCVYGVPVGERLFRERARHGWSRAREVAAAIGDEEDPAGDLADELGDGASAGRRLESLCRRFVGSRGVVPTGEPRSLFFLRERGIPAALRWEGLLSTAPQGRLAQELGGRRWLVHESVWFSRRLGRAEEAGAWIASARSAGFALEIPFASGRDCIDCGGEGAYARLFPEQAMTMARSIWERDRHRADGILCFSARCAAHFRGALGGDAPVLALEDFFEGARNGV